MSHTLISVLMPVKNAAPFLEECLDSIIGQSFPDWELIAVDDNSADKSRHILKSYAARDERIQVLKNNGNGIIPALRLACNNCHGKLISRMDADDLMAPRKLEVLKNNLLKFGPGHVAVGQVRYFSKFLLGEGYKKYAVWLNGLTGNGANFQELYKECVIPSPCWMVFREDLESLGGFEPELYPEDYDLCFRFYKYGLKCIPCTQELHYWRDHPLRTSRTSRVYEDNSFLDLKCHYFLKLDHIRQRPLVLWGAGKKGKKIAGYFKLYGQDFSWVSENDKKIGQKIYGLMISGGQLLDELMEPQIIVAVADKKGNREIQNYFMQKKLIPMKDYFFFC